MKPLIRTRSALPLRILVRSVNWLGDAVMTTPALLRLREAHPEAFIALLVPDKLAGLWTGHPAISLVLPFAPKERARSIAARLKDLRFGVGLTLPSSFRSAFELWLAGIPIRVGYGGQFRRWLLTASVEERPGTVLMEKRSKREILRLTSEQGGQASGLMPHAAAVPATAHQMHHYLHLVSELGASSAPVPPKVAVSAAEMEECLRRLQLEADPGRPFFGLNPGAQYGPAKRWPAESFIAAAREIQRRTDCRWLVLGGKGDADLAARITAGISETPPGEAAPGSPAVVNLAGATSLRDLCAVLKACRVLLTNDSGPMHVAAALGTPVIALFGSTSPELTGPGLPGDPRHRLLMRRVPCAPCFLRQCPIDLRCLRGITQDDAVGAVLDCAGSPSQRPIVVRSNG
jgi:heptosyltransferase-2